MPALLLAGCAAGGAVPCAYCDGGKRDTRRDSAADSLASEAAALDQTEGETTAPSDVADASLPATRDAPAGEPRVLTPILDAGYVLIDDFETGEAFGWEELPAPGSNTPPHNFSVILGDMGTLYAQGMLDADRWHIAYATAALGPDQIVEVKLRVVDFYAETPSYMAALFGRFDPATDSGYFVALRGDGSVSIRRRAHGVNASWGGGVALGIRPGVWYTVRLEIVGAAIDAFLDGEPVYSVRDDNPLAGGGVALGGYGATLEADRVVAAEVY